MSTVPSFSEGQIEALARLLGECGSGTDISRVLLNRGLDDKSGESTKWRRLYWIFLDCQRQHGCANRIIDFIQSFLVPARFVGRNDEFEVHRQQLNTILSFSGLEYGKDGISAHAIRHGLSLKPKRESVRFEQNSKEGAFIRKS
jgi:hypothetical protein